METATARAWWEGRMLGFDLESTSPRPEEARIVQYGLAWVGGDEPPVRHAAIVDPGVEIPAEAAEVHGITTERARAEGVPISEALEFILEQLVSAAARGVPAVIFNARYDLTVVDREARRLNLGVGDYLHRLRVVDPMVIDKWLDRYRRSYPPGHDAESAKRAGIPSSRTLEGMCRVYRARLDAAHDASSDAISAARLAYRMGQRGIVIRRTHDAEYWAARKLWEKARNDLDVLHEAQRRVALEERERFAAYKRSVGDAEDADRIELERGWPILEVMPHEPWFTGVEAAA